MTTNKKVTNKKTIKETFNILVPDRLKPPADIEEAVFGDRGTVILKQATDAADIDDTVWSNCDAVLAWHELQFTEAVLSKMVNCKILVRVGVGFDNVDLEAATRCGIIVSNVPDYGTNDVADHATAFILQAARGLLSYHRSVVEGDWRWEVAPRLRRLTGQTLGIIGFGRIGKAVALRAKAFGMNVCFYDPYVPEGIDKTFQMTRVRDILEIAECSDYVSLHTPLTDETRGMIGEAFFQQCREGVIFINTARGPILDINALYEAMKSGKVEHAAMDVLPVEPPDNENLLYRDLRADEPWLRGRLMVTPHAAFYNKESYEEIRRKAAEEALRVLEGHAPLNRVNAIKQ